MQRLRQIALGTFLFLFSGKIGILFIVILASLILFTQVQFRLASKNEKRTDTLVAKMEPTVIPTATPSAIPTPTSTPTPVPPTPTAIPTPTPIPPTPTPSTPPTDPNDNSVWDRLAECESHQNWSINSGNGYFGGLQFTQSAWESVGGAGKPHEASRDEQINRAKMLQAARGWAPWNECTAELGLH